MRSVIAGGPMFRKECEGLQDGWTLQPGQDPWEITVTTCNHRTTKATLLLEQFVAIHKVFTAEEVVDFGIAESTARQQIRNKVESGELIVHIQQKPVRRMVFERVEDK